MYNFTKKDELNQQFPFSFQFLDDPKSLVKQIYTKSHLFSMILDSLKQYEPYACVFLQKVSKREVPHYYEIIKNPMDLGTMSKKKYHDKESFKADLDLIWDNCVYFNGQSTFSEYAEKMRSKANYLYDMYLSNEDNNAIKYVESHMRNNKEDQDTTENALQETQITDLKAKDYFMSELQETCDFDFLEVKQNEFVKVESLESVIFEHRKIKVGKNSFFNNQIRNKECDFELNEECAKSIVEEVILLLLHKIGYKKVQKNAVTLFRDVLYHKIFGYMKNIDKKEMMNELESIKPSDLNIFSVYDNHNENVEASGEVKHTQENKEDSPEINYDIL